MTARYICPFLIGGSICQQQQSTPDQPNGKPTVNRWLAGYWSDWSSELHLILLLSARLPIPVNPILPSVRRKLIGIAVPQLTAMSCIKLGDYWWRKNNNWRVA
jgi:hypothetical protein